MLADPNLPQLRAKWLLSQASPLLGTLQPHIDVIQLGFADVNYIGRQAMHCLFATRSSHKTGCPRASADYMGHCSPQ